MSDIIIGGILLFFGFGLGALFSNWQTRVEDQLDADDEPTNLPPDWARVHLN